MSASGRKRKQQLKPRQDVQRSPVKRQSLDAKAEPLLASSYPLADYDCVDIKPDLTELQLQLAVAMQHDEPPPATETASPSPTPTPTATATAAATATATAAATATTTTTTSTLPDEVRTELEQQSDSDDDGYSENNFGPDHDVFREDEVDDYDPEWTMHATKPRAIFKFATAPSQMGVKALRKLICPLYYFNQLLGNRSAFFSLLAGGCNGNGDRVEASAEELETFMGLCLLMSDIKLPQLDDYWSAHVYQGFAGFGSRMSHDRFLQLLGTLSFIRLPGGGGSACSAAGDVGYLINFYNTRMSELYASGQQLVLNEPIIQWKDKFSYHNELPDKQRRNAMMLHLLSEPSGLTMRIIPHLVTKHVARSSRQLVAHRCQLALKLLQEHQHRGHILYVCKYYGSYGLGQELAKVGTYCTGLLDRNRYGNSKALIYEPLTPNSFAVRYAAPLMMAKWRRREKSMYFYSSDCVAISAKEMFMPQVNVRPKLIQEIEFRLRPANSTRQQLISYQPNCAGLDRQQQLAIFVLNMFVYNAHLLYVANALHSRGHIASTEPIKLKTYAEFRVAIIKSLLREETLTVQPESEATPDAIASAFAAVSSLRQEPPAMSASSHTCAVAQAEVAGHTHELVPILRNGQVLRKNCRHCQKGGMLQFTKYKCHVCKDTPGFCLTPCFRLWHEQLQQQHNAKVAQGI